VILHPTPVTLSAHRAFLWRKVVTVSASEHNIIIVLVLVACVIQPDRTPISPRLPNHFGSGFGGVCDSTEPNRTPIQGYIISTVRLFNYCYDFAR
jgi:hypothetical protein